MGTMSLTDHQKVIDTRTFK